MFKMRFKFLILFSFVLRCTASLSISSSKENLSFEIEEHLNKWLQNKQAELNSCAGLRSEFSALQSELRAVASLASQCADAKEAIRRCENDHTVIHWLKESVTEIRREISEIAARETITSRDASTSQSVKELRDVVSREVSELRHELQELKVREFSDEAKHEEELLDLVEGEEESNRVEHHNRHRHSHHIKDVTSTQNLDKEVDNIGWFLHQLYEEQEKLKEQMKKQKRAIHKLVIKEKQKGPQELTPSTEIHNEELLPKSLQEMTARFERRFNDVDAKFNRHAGDIKHLISMINFLNFAENQMELSYNSLKKEISTHLKNNNSNSSNNHKDDDNRP